MDLDTKPQTHPDLEPRPVKRRVVKAVGLAALVIAILAIVLFVGFNAFYVGQAT